MIVEVVATPNSKRFSITMKDKLKISLKSPPENNRANHELVNELTRLSGRPVSILSGLTSRKKRLRIDISENEWQNLLSKILKNAP